MLYAVRFVYNSIKIKSWLEYENKLSSTISLEKLFQEEMCNRQVLFTTGKAGALFTAIQYNRISDHPLPIDFHTVLTQIKESNFWKEDINPHHLGLDGYLGIKYLFDYLKPYL